MLGQFSMEYWVQFVDVHRPKHVIFNYAVFAETQSPMYDAGYELAFEHNPPGFKVPPSSSCFASFSSPVLTMVS